MVFFDNMTMHTCLPGGSKTIRSEVAGMRGLLHSSALVFGTSQCISCLCPTEFVL